MVVNPEDYLAVFNNFVLPENERRAWLASRNAVIVGRTTAKRFHWKIGDRVPIQSPIWPKKGGSQTWEFDVAGIYDASKDGADTTQMLIHYDYFDETRQYGQGQIGWYPILIDDPTKC